MRSSNANLRHLESAPEEAGAHGLRLQLKEYLRKRKVRCELSFGMGYFVENILLSDLLARDS